MNTKKEKYSQTSQLENPEEIRLHHNHDNFPVFDCAVALFTFQNVLLVISNVT
jgi:hypothetical protein